ncbi:MAG: putative ABC transporter permease [Bacilli bacterium]|nr:putative ABC transporter permease [Bacilli bacterium]
MYLLNSFFMYSIIGYIMEILVGFIVGADNPESGILYGPWTPIYGFSSILIILISESLFKKLHLSKWKETIIIFLIIIFVLMGIEYLGGYLIELVFGFSFWDYSNYKFNLGKYTCFEMGIVWGILGVLFIYFFRPFLDKYIKKIPRAVTIILTFLIILDLLIRLLKEYYIF